MPVNSRMGAVDFWRGAVLVAILVDHIPGNGLERLTPRNFGLSDSAEAFVFLSGVSVGAAYLKRAERDGITPVAKACGKRTLLLYATHIGLTMAAIALFGLVSSLTGASELLDAHGRDLAFRDPSTAVRSILLLGHQLGYFNILPLYIVVMAFAPAILALTMRSSALALAASIGLYAAVRLWDVNLPTSPDPGTWFFNPFAWQLAFTLGVVVARLKTERRIGFHPALLAASAAVAVVGAAIVNDGFGFWPGLHAAVDPWIDHSKQNLGLGRLVNFVALAYFFAFAPFSPALVASRIGSALQQLGRHSLVVFAAGSLLSAGGQALLVIIARSPSAPLTMPLGCLYTLVSTAVLFFLAHRLECKNPTPPPHGGESAPPSPRLSSALRPSMAQ